MSSDKLNNDIRSLNLIDDDQSGKWALAAHEAIMSIEDVVLNLLSGKSYISPSAKIHPTAVIGDNVFIGSNVEIGPYSYIRSFVVLCDDVKIGYCVEVDRCILFERVKASHHASIGRCIIGQDSNLAFGFVIATRNLYNKPIIIHLPNSKTIVSTRKHHGAAIGSRLKTGVNVAIMPGITIFQDVTIRPSQIITRYVLSHKSL